MTSRSPKAFEKPAPLPPIGNWGVPPQTLSANEKLTCAICAGLLAGASSLPFAGFLEPLPLALSAGLAGWLVLPRFFSLDRWRPGRAFLGGMLATFCTAGIVILLLSITLLHSGQDFTEAHGTVFGIILIGSSGLALIGGLTAVLLDWLLLRKRQGS